MNHSEADITLVERYFDAELTDAEIKDFNSRMESDQNFKALVKQEMALIAAIRYEGAAANLKYLEDLEAKLQKDTAYSHKFRFNQMVLLCCSCCRGDYRSVRRLHEYTKR
jgi:hypothetical protein